MDELVTIKAPTAGDAAIAGESLITFRLDYRCEQHQLQVPMQAGSIPLPVGHMWVCIRLTGEWEEEAEE